MYKDTGRATKREILLYDMCSCTHPFGRPAFQVRVIAGFVCHQHLWQNAPTRFNWNLAPLFSCLPGSGARGSRGGERYRLDGDMNWVTA